MTVKELIERLKLAPEDIIVRRGDGDTIGRVEIILTEIETEDHVNIY